MWGHLGIGKSWESHPASPENPKNPDHHHDSADNIDYQLLIHPAMSTLNLQDVVALSYNYPDLSFGQVQQFISLASKLKNDILLAQPLSVPAFNPPDILPPTITTFLQKSCGISVSCVDKCWEALKSTIWNDDHLQVEDSILVTQDFATHGHPLGLCASKCVPRLKPTSWWLNLSFL